MTTYTRTTALSSAQGLSIILVILLTAVTFAYLGTSIVDSSQISNLQSKSQLYEEQYDK